MNRVKSFTLPDFFDNTFANKILEMEVYDDDVWITSFPKSGTTWTQEMVWMLVNDLDYDRAKESLEERCPFLEGSSYRDYKAIEAEHGIDLSETLLDSLKAVETMKRPRVIKTHLPWVLLPKKIQEGKRKPKIIHVTRNPKDVCTSYYHHQHLFYGVEISSEEFVNNFMEDKEFFTPYWENVRSYWKHRNGARICFLSYESMKKDLRKNIRLVANFLNTPLSKCQEDSLCDHLNFNNMRQNKAVNKSEELMLYRKLCLIRTTGNFIRSGRIGDNKNLISETMMKAFDQWMEKNMGNMAKLFKA